MSSSKTAWWDEKKLKNKTRVRTQVGVEQNIVGLMEMERWVVRFGSRGEKGGEELSNLRVF